MMTRPIARIEQIYYRKTAVLVGLFLVLLLPTIVTAASTTTTSKRPGWRLPKMRLGNKSTDMSNVTQSSEIKRNGT
jgi:hypothetical protein